MSQKVRETSCIGGPGRRATRRRFLSLGGLVLLAGASRVSLADATAAQDAPQFGTQCKVGAAIAISFSDVLAAIFGPTPTASLIGFTMAPQALIRVLDPDPRDYRIEYRPRPGFVGWDDFDLYAYVDGQPRTVGMFVEVSGSFAELPPARRTIRVASSSQLTAALAGNFAGLPTTPTNAAGPLGAGDHVLLGDGAYAGTFTLGRNGGAPTDADRNGVPIVIRAENLLGARLTGKFSLNGVNGWLHGLDFDGQNQNAAIGVTLGGDHARVMRCRFRRHRTAAEQEGGAVIVSMAASYNKVWYCEFTDFDGRPVSSRTTGSAARYPHLYRNHWHDNVTPPGTSSGNARECLQLGQTQGDGRPVRTPMFGLVEHNLLEDLYVGAGHDETEPFSNKSSSNVYRYNSFDNVKNYLTLRFGLDC
ncbi:MAG: chondroitinase-B domain-containing protein, partial [Dehalococcoidia bacterium]